MVARSVSRKATFVSMAVAAAFAAALMAAAFAPAQAYAANVEYVDRSWDGTSVVSVTQMASAQRLTDADEDDLTSGWYVADETYTYGIYDRWEINGTVNLVLCDGVKIHCKDGIHVPAGSTLNIYCQQGGTGASFPDALAGAALQGKNKSVMVLVKDGKLAGVEALATAKANIQHGYILGGASAVSDQLAATIATKTDMTFAK